MLPSLRNVNRKLDTYSKYRLPVLLTMFFVLLGLLASLIMLQQSQDLRQQAAIVPTPLPIEEAPPAPSGCYYQQVQCFQAPCEPILVCPSPATSPVATPVPSPATCGNNICEAGEGDILNCPVCEPGDRFCQLSSCQFIQAGSCSIDCQPQPVSLQTEYASLTADDMSIEVGDKTYRIVKQSLRLDSNPSSPPDYDYLTLEAQWDNGPIPMRMYLYFSTDQQDWWLLGLRTYDGSSGGEWLYYENEPGNTLFKTPYGSSFSQAEVELTSLNGLGKLRFSNLALTPTFRPGASPSPSASPSTRPSASPIPEGCFLKPVQCIQGPCDPVLVCPTPKPIEETPSPTCQPIPEDCIENGRVICQFSSILPVCPPASIRPSATPSPGVLRADLNHDGRVDILDYTILAGELLQDLDEYQADITGDGRVDLLDFAILNQEFSLL